MGESTKIQWCDHTFNPWRGCQKVAPGCANCYANSQAARNPSTLGIWGPNGTRVVASESMWREPVKWNRAAEKTGERPRVFCGSMMDWAEDWRGSLLDSRGRQLFTVNGEDFFTEPEYPECRPLALDDVRRRLFRLIDSTSHLDWLLLTKRPENIRRMYPSAECVVYRDGEGLRTVGIDGVDRDGARRAYRPSVWLGTSIACQQDADRNVPELLRCRDLSPVLFISVEPLVGPVDITPWMFSSDGFVSTPNDGPVHRRDGGAAIDWVIVGGESGPNARPCRPEWIRAIVRQCKEAGVLCFVKQLGANVVTRNDMIEDVFNGKDGWPDPQVEHHIHGFREDYQGADCRVRLRDPKGGAPLEWPAYLRVREIPKPSSVC